jgi:hypothetical protein
MASKSSKSKKQADARERIEKLVDKAIAGIERKLQDQGATLTVGDCLKVMQLQKELEDEQLTEVTVTWVDPEPKSEK